MYSRKQKIIFIHIPRTAGTSIAWALKEYSDDFQYPIDERNNLTQHWTYDEYKNELKKKYNEDINDYFVFTIVRNPWDRLISHFTWHTEGSDNSYFNENHRKILNKGVLMKPRGRYLFKDRRSVTFDLYMENLGYIYTELEKRTQYDTLRTEGKDDLDHIDLIIRYETLKDGFDILRDEVSSELLLRSSHKTDHKHYSEYFQGNSVYIEKFLSFFRKDVEFFNYPYGVNDGQ